LVGRVRGFGIGGSWNSPLQGCCFSGHRIGGRSSATPWLAGFGGLGSGARGTRPSKVAALAVIGLEGGALRRLGWPGSGLGSGARGTRPSKVAALAVIGLEGGAPRRLGWPGSGLGSGARGTRPSRVARHRSPYWRAERFSSSTDQWSPSDRRGSGLDPDERRLRGAGWATGKEGRPVC